MNLTKINIEFDDESSFNYENPKGLNFSNIFNSLGLSMESMTEADPKTWKGALQNFLFIVVGVLARRIGLPF